MVLKDTIRLMQSDDYEDRLKAEYHQTRIRYEKLHRLCIRYDADTLEFNPVCSVKILKKQVKQMRKYLRILEIRAEIEGVDLNRQKAPVKKV